MQALFLLFEKISNVWFNLNDIEYPALYQAASELSQKSQNAFYRAFLLHMVLLAIATVISIINSTCAEMAILQAMVLLGALMCAVYLFASRPDRQWYGGRAVAESIKTLTWRYVSKAEPFEGEDRIARNQFGLKLKAIIDQNKGVSSLLSTNLEGEQLSPLLDVLRQASKEDRLKYYREKRIVEQQKWYAQKAAFNRRMVKKFFTALMLVIGIAILLALVKIKYPLAPYWPTDFFVTSAAGILSWIQAKKFQELSASYTLTAHEISLIREQSGNAMTDAELSSFIGDSENAFSREHTQWIARKDT